MNQTHYLVALFFWIFFWGCYYSLGALASSLSFFNLFMVTLAVVATLVANSQAPPAKVILQALHFQIPHDTLLTAVQIISDSYLSAGWADVLSVLLKLKLFHNFSNSSTISGSIFSDDTHLFSSFGHWLINQYKINIKSFSHLYLYIFLLTFYHFFTQFFYQCIQQQSLKFLYCLAHKTSIRLAQFIIIFIEVQTHLCYSYLGFMITVIPIPCTKVYVCFLPSYFQQQNVKEIFSKFGNILDMILRKRKDGFTYAHITYESIEQAQICIKQMNRKQIQEKILKVNFSVPNCVPKSKRQKKLTKDQQAEDCLQSYLRIGNKNRKKEVKIQKKQRKADYLEKLQQTFRTIVQMETSIERNKKKQEKQKKQKISMADLKTLQMWLKPKKQPLKHNKEDDTAWEQSSDFGQAKKNRI